MPRIIQYLLAAIKLQIENDCLLRQQTQQTSPTIQQIDHEPSMSLPVPTATNTLATDTCTSSPQKLCYADKCRVLIAKGILQHPIPCAKGRNLCPGCIIECTRQRKTATIEGEILETNTPNHILAPFLDHLTISINIKELRCKLQHLPTMNQNKRDDCIFGVIRYVANSLGLCLNNATASSIDEPMCSTQVKQRWRQATYRS